MCQECPYGLACACPAGVECDLCPVLSGQQACEGNSLSEQQCNKVGCCQFEADSGLCMSTVGNGTCGVAFETTDWVSGVDACEGLLECGVLNRVQCSTAHVQCDAVLSRQRVFRVLKVPFVCCPLRFCFAGRPRGKRHASTRKDPQEPQSADRVHLLILHHHAAMR